MDEVKLWMAATQDIPELEIKRGDVIRWNKSASEHPFLQTRRRSFDYGAILVSLNTGALEPIVVTHASESAPASLSPSMEQEAAQALRPILRLHRSLG